MKLDPQAFAGTAPYYARGRPPYSAELAPTLERALGLDGSGRLLDVGCGPAVLVLRLAPLFAETVALDPEPGMLAEGQRRAEAAGLSAVRWLRGLAEEVADLAIGPCRLVTFGQSFHRVDQELVADRVYDLLEPGGAMALITHLVRGRAAPEGTGHPAIPHAEIRDLVIAFLGDDTMRYLAYWSSKADRFEDVLEQSRFGRPEVLYAPGRADLVVDVDVVVANYFSMSYAAPRLFGDRRDEFEAALRRLLYAHSPEGLFWEWPGDTEIVLARKP